jgi:N-acetylmuramoyl-L-alanine amidase
MLKNILPVSFCLLTAVGVGALSDEEIQKSQPFMPEGRPLEGLVITLDAGHGGSSHQAGYAGSARGTNSDVVEGDINMLVTAELRWHLVHAGAKVHMSRWDDRRVTLNPMQGEPTGRSEELGARVDVAKESASHLFLSLHHNSTTRRTADGVVVLIWPTDSQGNEQPLEIAFADALEEEVRKLVPNKEDFNHYLNEHPLVTFSDIPSAVIEFGFLSNPEFDEWVSQGDAHLPESEAVYNAILKLWQERGEELRAKRQELFPESKPVPPREEVAPSKALANSLWPFKRTVETEEEAEWLLSQYKKTVLSDSTLFHLEPDVYRTEEGWVVQGQVSHPIIREAAAALLKEVGLTPLRNNLELLPTVRVGSDEYGVVQIPMALTWAKPKEGESVQTQLLLGEPVFILDVTSAEDYYLIQGGDSYIGWVRSEAVRRMPGSEFNDWMRQPMVRLRKDFLVDDYRLPAGAMLPLKELTATSATLVLPRGVRATQRREEAIIPADVVMPQSAMDIGQAAVDAAEEFLTTPYVFGGRSKLGLDCSGLVGSSYAATGIVLPRDARQQVLSGSLVATRSHPAPLQPGDTIYFLDDTGRVFHTALSLGGARYIHSSPPHVHVLSLDPADKFYSKEWADRFALARRPVDWRAAEE